MLTRIRVNLADKSGGSDFRMRFSPSVALNDGIRRLIHGRSLQGKWKMSFSCGCVDSVKRAHTINAQSPLNTGVENIYRFSRRPKDSLNAQR